LYKAALIVLLFGTPFGFFPKEVSPHRHGPVKPATSRIQQRLLSIALEEANGHVATGHKIGDSVVYRFKEMPDSQRNCGGLCFKVARDRVNRAFLEVTGKPLNDWIPASMATPFLTPKQAFDWTWNINTQNNEIWRSLPDMRACGSAGAIQLAKLGQIKGNTQVWNGELLPGAVVQVFVYVSDFEKVRYGIDNPRARDNLASYGHSFIFLEYVRDEYENITGMRVADQGFLNKIIVTKSMYHIWWGANILDPK
jgi:hypothetical protein